MCLKKAVSLFSWPIVVLAALMLLATGCGWERDNPWDRKGVNKWAEKDSAPHQDMTVMVDKGPDDRTVDGETITPWDIGGTSTDGISKVGNMGEGCSKVADCTGKSAICLNISKTTGASTCSTKCTPDDIKTPLVNEDSCPKNFTCARITMSDQSIMNYCLKVCIPSDTKNPCPKSSKTACRPYSSRAVSPGKAVCRYSACTVNKDCPVWATTTCSTDGDCASVGKGAFCLSKTCAMPGKCLTAAGICGPHPGVGKKTAKVGDPCKSDLDCSESGFCILESNSYTGAIGVAYRNGYCAQRECMFANTMPSFKCPTGSHCNMRYYGGYCFKSCKLSDTKGCRGQAKDKGGDYECYDWSGWTTSGVKIAAGPTCQNASTRTCDTVNSKTYCAALATDSKNPTKMKCRDRYTGASLSDPKSKKGICLDDTASGAFDKTKPDAGPAANAGAAKDAGTGQ